MPSGSARVRTHLDRLRRQSPATKMVVALALDAAPRERHRLGGGGRLVEHRRVGDRHAGEVAHHGLEVDQRLHAALRDLGLVGRVGGVPGRVLEHVAQDDARRVRAVVALADEALQHAVLRRDGAQLGERLRPRRAARGSRIGAARAIERGTICSISARRDAAPMTDSMCASSSASMPMWRGMNSPAFRARRAASGGRHQHRRAPVSAAARSGCS